MAKTMSIDTDDGSNGARHDVSQLLARSAADDARPERRVAAAVAQLSQPADMRLDDRTRARVGATTSRIILAVESDLRAQAGRALAARDAPDLALVVADAGTGGAIEALLLDAGLFAHPEFVADLVARATQDLLAEALPMTAPSHPDQPSLLARLSASPDGAVAAAAMALLAADVRRRTAQDGSSVARPDRRTDLRAELQHMIVWRVAAALCLHVAQRLGMVPAAVDRALTDAAQRSLAAHDESDGLEAAALHLAVAIGANAEELPDLLVESIADRQLPLFIALIAHATAISYDMARDLVLDPVADRLWLALRALDLNRDAVARIGLALCEADPRRDVDAFADQLATIAAIAVDAARAAMAPMRRHPDFRAAMIAVAQGVQAGAGAGLGDAAGGAIGSGGGLDWDRGAGEGSGADWGRDGGRDGRSDLGRGRDA